MTPPPPPYGALQSSSWQVPPATPESQIVPKLRARLVALVAALAVQGTIALLGVMPGLPTLPVTTATGSTYYEFHPVNFWAQFAVIEYIAAGVVSLAFGPGVRLRDVPSIGRAVLGLAFVVVPAAAIVIGAIDASHAAATDGAAISASWLSTAFFAIAFFGLPLLALGRDRS